MTVRLLADNTKSPSSTTRVGLMLLRFITLLVLMGLPKPRRALAFRDSK